MFRPYRDVPFRQGQDALQDPPGCVRRDGSVDRLVRRVSAPRRTSRWGYYEAAARTGSPGIRAAIAEDRTGTELLKILRGLERKGWDRGGERLKAAPRGYDADHPRIELLRHKSLTLGKSVRLRPDDPTLRSCWTQVRTDWRAARPLVEWIAANAG